MLLEKLYYKSGFGIYIRYDNLIPMKNLLLVILLFSSYFNYAQITFEKGYFFNNDNIKINCFIKNVDWLNNPDKIDYRISEGGETLTAKVEDISEFGVADLVYKKFSTQIDGSGVLLETLSHQRKPEFEMKTVFLRRIVSGKASLYDFVEGNISLYFFETDELELVPLIYKRYHKNSNVIGVNNNYKQQLLSSLKCDSSLANVIGRIKYLKKELKTLFENYNKCVSGESEDEVVTGLKTKKGFFNMSIRPGVSLNNFRIGSRANFFNTNPDTYEFDFGQNSGYQLGVELEYVFPFNKNKWSIFVEPSFNTFSAETSSLTAIPVDVTLNYKTIDLPIGLRYYLFVTPKSKIFINGSYVLIFDLNSQFKPARNGFVFSKGTNNTIGLGYDIQGKFKIEARYDADRGSMFPLGASSRTEFTSYSLVLGYSFL